MIDLIGLSNSTILEILINDEDLTFRKVNIDFLLMCIEEMMQNV